MRRWAVAGLLVVAIALVAWWLWPRGEVDHDLAGQDDAAPADIDRADRSGEDEGGDTAFDPGPPPTDDGDESERRMPVRLSRAEAREDPTAVHGVLAGRVLAWGSGRPIGGAELDFEHEDRTHSVSTDGDGRFELRAPEPGEYTLAVATADGFLPFAPEWEHSPIRFHARPGVRVDGVTVYLVDAVSYVARVVDEEGQPVAGARARVLGAGSGDLTLAPLTDRYVSGADGEFTFSAPDDAVVEASHPDRGHGRAAVDEAVQTSGRMTIRLGEPSARLRGGLHITGRVVDAEDTPIDGALVLGDHILPDAEDERGLHPVLQATTDGEGLFTLEEADEGSYRLAVSAPGYAGAHQSPVRSGAEDVVIRLTTELRIRVTVVDAADGAPVPAATALAQEVLGPLRRETAAVASGFDGEGVVVIGGLDRGRYEVIAVAHGYAPSEPVAVALDSGEATVRIDLVRGGRVTGTVVSAEGSRPLAGARVSLEDRIGAGSAAVPLSASVLSNEDGRFELGGVPGGPRSVVIYAADHHGRILSGVQVRSGETIDLGTLDLTPTDEGERPRLELAGVGAVLSSQEDVLVIQRVIDGGGAAEVGLVPGDAIVEVAGSPVTTLGFGGAIEAIRGPEGTSVQLLIRRADGAVVLVAVPRRRIRA